MSVAGGPQAFDPKQTWRVVSGYVPDCPVGTIVTLSTRGPIFDVVRPWHGLAASVDMRTTTVLVSPDGRSCLIRSTEGDAMFTLHTGNPAPVPTSVAPVAAPAGGPIVAPPPVQPSAPADALRSLNELKDQGLVSDDEYAAKRTEILSRL